MAKISLVPYKFSIKTYVENEENFFPEFSDLENNDGENISFSSIIEDFFTNVLSLSVTNRTYETFLHSNLKAKDENHIKISYTKVFSKRNKHVALGDQFFGLIKVGKYGSSGMITEIDTGSTNYIKQPNETDAIPLYFNIFIPYNQNEGLIFLQRHGLTGMKSALIDELYNFIREYNDNYQLTVTNFAPYELVKQELENSSIPKLRLIKYNEPKDSDKKATLPNDGISKEEVEIRGWEKLEKIFSLSPKGGNIVKRNIIENLSQKRKFSDIVEFDKDEYDEIKAELHSPNSKKVLDISNLQKFNCSIDVTRKVGLDKNGHPKFDLIHKEGDYYLQEFAKHIGVIFN